MRLWGYSMKSLTMLTALLFAGTAQAGSNAAPPAELLPSGKWQVEYAKSSCIISRQFGQKPNAILFGIKPSPNSDIVSLFVIQSSGKARGIRGVADIRLSSGYTPDSANYWSVTSKGLRVTTIGLPRPALEALAKGDSIAIKAGESVNATLKPTGFDRVLKALEDCESDLLTSWGFDKAAQAAVAKRPQGSFAGVFNADDYPSDALESGLGGSVGFRLRIEQDGKISDCAVIESSGTPSLDKQTCAVVKKRARFSPALGHDGKPIWSFTFGRTVWMTGS